MGNIYESKDKVQDYIIRQSSLNRAVEYYAIYSTVPPPKDDIVELADYFAKWVKDV